jgi:hypothetical protein
MDFLTASAYWSIPILVIINAIVVMRMKVRINDDNNDSDGSNG